MPFFSLQGNIGNFKANTELCFVSEHIIFPFSMWVCVASCLRRISAGLCSTLRVRGGDGWRLRGNVTHRYPSPALYTPRQCDSARAWPTRLGVGPGPPWARRCPGPAVAAAPCTNGTMGAGLFAMAPGGWACWSTRFFHAIAAQAVPAEARPLSPHIFYAPTQTIAGLWVCAPIALAPLPSTLTSQEFTVVLVQTSLPQHHPTSSLHSYPCE